MSLRKQVYQSQAGGGGGGSSRAVALGCLGKLHSLMQAHRSHYNHGPAGPGTAAVPGNSVSCLVLQNRLHELWSA